MKPLWKIRSGRFAGWRTEDGLLYDDDGAHVGYFVKDIACSNSAHLIGELYGGRLLGRRKNVICPAGMRQMARAAKTVVAGAMDSILPDWRDSLVMVSEYDKRRAGTSGIMLDSASSRILTGVPAMLVIDSAGLVRHSVPAGLPQVTHVLDFVGIPSPTRMLVVGLLK